MENESNSCSEISITDSSNSASLQSNEKSCKLSSEENFPKNDSDVNLENRSATHVYTNFENNGTPEELSAVFEHSEGTQDNCDKETVRALQNRIRLLQTVMANLRDELKEEIWLWRKEKEEFELLREKRDILALEEATAAARAAAIAYAAEAPLSNDLGDALDITSEEALRELTILEYEKKLAKYQDDFSFTQAEKRYNTRWQLVAQAYKQKLLEIERLCNEELEKVRQSANSLQPLKEIASEWYIHGKNHGDSVEEIEYNSQVQKCGLSSEDSYYNFHKIDAEVNMVPEIYAAKFKCDDSS